MNNIEDLIQKASELQSYGLVIGQIADELNVSKETVTGCLKTQTISTIGS